MRARSTAFFLLLRYAALCTIPLKFHTRRKRSRAWYIYNSLPRRGLSRFDFMRVTFVRGFLESFVIFTRPRVEEFPFFFSFARNAVVLN